jgi:hypothetical protein
VILVHRRVRASLARLALGSAALALVLAPLVPAARAAGPPSSTPGSGHGSGRGNTGSSQGNGRVIAILPDGTLRDPCTAFTQVTESPFTLADGKLEVAAGEVSLASARLDSIRTRSVDVGSFGVTRGFPNRWALAVALDEWSGLSLTTGPVSGEVNPGGFGGGTLSARHTFFGVDSAGMALGFVATFVLPGASTSPLATTYGAAVALPFSASLPLDVTLGAMVQLGTLADAQASGHHLRWIESVKLDRELVPHLGGWLEVVDVDDLEAGYARLGTLNAGVSAELGRHLALSLGVAAGRAHGTSDHGVFGGFAIHV